MRVEGAYTFPGDIERVFRTLTNPDALARAIPGCERFIQFGPADADGETGFETRLRLGQRRQPYTIALRVKAARRPAYLKLDLRGYGPSGPITGVGSLDLVEQESHTVVAYRFTLNGADAPGVGEASAASVASEVGAAPSQSASFIARATCAHLADELYAETEDRLGWLPNADVSRTGVKGASGADGASGKGGIREFVTPRGRIRARVARVSALDERRASKVGHPPLAWTERAIWMSAGLAMGLSAIALTAAIVRRIGAREERAS